MNPLTLESYFIGPDGVRRDEVYADECTDEIRANAEGLIPKVNALLERMEADGVPIEDDENTGSPSHSGWRSKVVNEHTANAADHSRHLDGHADDLKDPQRALATWAVNNLDVLEELGLYIEDPRWCPTWLHVQDVPPGSGHRCYIPSTAPAKCAALPGQVV